MNAYLLSEKTRDSSYDKQCLHSFPKPVEQIKLPRKAHTKAFSSSDKHSSQTHWGVVLFSVSLPGVTRCKTKLSCCWEQRCLMFQCYKLGNDWDVNHVTTHSRPHAPVGSEPRSLWTHHPRLCSYKCHQLDQSAQSEVRQEKKRENHIPRVMTHIKP